MKWVEIISLRCPANIDLRFVDELFKEVSDSASPQPPVEIRVYRHSTVETDLSFHIHWESENSEIPRKSPLGLRFASALRNLGLLNHSVWAETKALKINHRVESISDVR
jgi:hypothetical protein